MCKYVTILNFSSRNNGNCAAISRFLANYHRNSNICVYNINEYFSPCCRCDYECLKPGKECPNKAQYKVAMDTIAASDMVYYIVPNFCGFPCANYFAFNERTVGYFNRDRDLMNRYMSVRKKFIIVSNSESDIFFQSMQQQSEDPEILYLKAKNYGKQSINGDLLDSEDVMNDLIHFLNQE